MLTLKNQNITIELTEIGARINAIVVHGADIALGFNSQEDYEKSGTYCGATIGRVCNRIANGKFTLDGKEYILTKNVGNNHLHGGIRGFDKQAFAITELTENSVTFEYVSADGEEGYPGKLTLTVKYTLKDNELLIEYTASSTQTTLWCPTNHVYFNLDGENSGDCLDNVLRINADKITVTNAELITTGEVKPVQDTPYDFTDNKLIGQDIRSGILAVTKGYDNNYILNGEQAAYAESKKTGVSMTLYTDLPCLQFYSGGQITEINGKNGKYRKWQGFCLEPQYCPNAVNLQDFEMPILKAGEQKKHYIKYCFEK
ncbi:MAG: galactose mutarotase [Clostridiales bacterium]|nr:galactose mutarotase [Clostridiales bacterium]